MQLLYLIGIQVYAFLLRIAALFNPKAKLWVEGRKNIFEKLEAAMQEIKEPVIWMHVSSLGEFEQGRPLIEQIKAKYPQYKIVLTFFSPSGYEIRKNYPLADAVLYLPIDTAKNAKRFLDIVKPTKVFFVKYDFWYHYLHEANKRNIPTYLISALFREEQLFFKSYGGFYRKILHFFTAIFVQDEKSADLLKSVNYNEVIISGDTRVDRVADLAEQVKPVPHIEEFKQDKLLIVAGSTWQPDEQLLISFLENTKDDAAFKVIIAPHEVHNSHIDQITNLLSDARISYMKYSSLKAATSVGESKVLIIDSIGLLSSLYQYGDIAYIGGGFGVGIHNTLEPAAFALPIVFGEKYQKFNEAVSLVGKGGAFSISNYSEFEKNINKLLTDFAFRKQSGSESKAFISKQRGAIAIVLSYCFPEQ